jgi:hypothetical protein
MNYADPGLEQEACFETFGEWFRSAIEDFIIQELELPEIRGTEWTAPSR